MKLEKVISFT